MSQEKDPAELENWIRFLVKLSEVKCNSAYKLAFFLAMDTNDFE